MLERIKRLGINTVSNVASVVLPSIRVVDSRYKIFTTIRDENAHIFRGYYDIDFFSYDRSYFLYHMLLKDSETKNQISIGVYDLKNQEKRIVGHSNCWCWQQGCRLRWIDKDKILLNDCIEDQYCSKIIDVNTNTVEKVYSMAFYDIHIGKKYGLGVNFSRLQRLRPGYGYRTLEDRTKGIDHPKDDGVYYYDMDSDKCNLLFSIYDVHELIGDKTKGEGYINHISISPNGNSFIFFYIEDMEKYHQKVYLMRYEFSNNSIYLIENRRRLSHYAWIDNEHLLTTNYLCGKQYYGIYHLNSGEYDDYGENILRYDGHPTVIGKDQIISDTYPLSRRFKRQCLFSYSENTNKINTIATFSTNPKYEGESRCDLHPSINDDMISVDTNCFGLRSIVILKKEI